ncbi:MAG: murein L,D-transpeptidase catalytic domain family protein [Gemmatimonadaceae bacterium]|nr:murein L,D-transpeptidase catalytic domain family protein [Chitinophagaceae bacterium]
MKQTFTRTNLLFLICIFVVTLLRSSASESAPATGNRSTYETTLRANAILAKSYARQKGLDTSVCFLIDMRIDAGKNRFFVFDFSSGKTMRQGLVTHGRCNQNWLSGRRYGNEVGCGCTSLGRYKVGKSYYGRFGLAYKLHGLDSTNSNAYKRYVVLHSMECVPEKEVDPMPICQSDGCPTVSGGFLKEISTLINKAGRPVLLWIYE